MPQADRRDALIAILSGVALFGATSSEATAQDQTTRDMQRSGKRDEPTFEQIDENVKALDLTLYQRGGKRQVTADRVRTAPAEVLSDICPIYQAVRGILVALRTLPLLPRRWRDAIDVFVDTVDVICG